MPIVVKYKDSTFGIVPYNDLQDLLDSKQIVAFQRSSRWVDPRRDPLRGQGSNSEYNGLNRRSIE